MNSLPFYFNEQIIFEQISSFLSISELVSLAQTNRLIKGIVENKCKRIIKSHNLSLIPSKTAIHQMRFYFDRCLTLYTKKQSSDQPKHGKVLKQKERLKQEKNNNPEKLIEYTLRNTLQDPFKYKTIIYFEVGVQYAVFLTIDREAYIFKTASLINTNHKKPQLCYEKRTNVAQIKCKAEHITYLTQKGQIFQIYGEKNSQQLINKQESLQWSRFIQIQKIQASFNYTIFKPKKNGILYEQFVKYIFHYEIDLDKVKKDNNSYQNNHQNQNYSKKSTLILLNNISFKYYLIQFQKQQKIIQYVVGNREAYFINQEFQCFVCYFQQDLANPLNMINQNPNNQNNRILKAKIFQPLNQKSIIKLASGYNFFIALQRKIHDVSKWTVEQVCKWVRDIGFGPFVKIFSAEKVDGKKLLNIDKNYMHSSLGITKPNMQQKFLMLIQEVMENKNKEDTLYGWGKNQNSQLGSRNAIFIKQPQKIKLPNCLKNNEHIDSIFCGWFETFIRTQKGRIYRTVNYEKKRKMTAKDQYQMDLKITQKMNKNLNEGKKMHLDYETGLQQQTDFGQKKNSAKNQKGNKKKKPKFMPDLSKTYNDHKKFQQEQKWIQCEVGKAFFVQGYKQFLFFIQCPSQKQFEPMKQKKLRPVKMVLNKIFWSLSTEQQSFYKIGYLDKDMGLIETTILQLKTFDINENRIKYIKKSNQIVWDRENKIDNVG